MPAIVAGGLLAFTLSIDEFMVTYFTYDARSMTLPILIYSEARTGLKLTLNAVSTLFIAGTVILVLAMELLRSRR